MKRVTELAQEEAAMSVISELTNVFEGLASMRISQIKDQVLQSTQFFHQLWAIYTQIRRGNQFSFGREHSAQATIAKDLLIIITAEAGFSGDIDQKLVELLLEDYDEKRSDIVVVGHHGANQLSQSQIKIKQYFKMPDQDRQINVLPIELIMRQYKSTKIYYQEYITLMVQDVKRIDLSKAVNERGETSEKAEDIINETTYIFEPSTYDVIAHLERSMMQITISQLILESKLAQYASRFKAMSLAHDRADEIKHRLHLDYNRSHRAAKDERLKEIINGLKKVRAGV